MLRSAVTLLACLAISSASATELTCKQWFEYGHRSHLPHRKTERMAEIRAANSLARLWRDQGKLTEARDLLAPVYNWFTEGFDTPVLQDAKRLLDELA